MSRFIVAPRAAADLAEIWRYIRGRSSEETADRVERKIREQFALLAEAPGIGHRRADLTPADVRFFPVYSYLIVYRQVAGREAAPIQIAAILHGGRELRRVLRKRL